MQGHFPILGMEPPRPDRPATRPGQTIPRRQADVVDYIEDMSRQLATMADEAGLDLLSYLLQMVEIEAKAVRARLAKTPG